MASPPDPSPRQLESALLFLSRTPEALGTLLRAALPGSVLEELSRAGGRRRAGHTDPTADIVHAIVHAPRQRLAVSTRLLEALPDGGPPSDAIYAAEIRDHVHRDAVLTSLRDKLCSEDESAWEAAAARLEEMSEVLGSAEEPPAEAKPEPAPDPAAAAEPEGGPGQQELDEARTRLDRSREEVARLQDELGREHKRREQLREELAELRGQLVEEQQRATRMKKRLADATEASERERLLEEEAELARRELHVARQKFDILEEEREDLHAVLQDHDRFLLVVEEEVASFRDRPLLAEEQELAAKLAEHRDAGLAPLRVLVIGGGEPQLRHHAKFEEYAGVMGFAGEWRMAEYTSWHKEMTRLASDMDRFYDALVILHWNRTTFTRKAREICNKGGNKPCLTCHYEGFTSLRQTLRETLRQLVAARERKGS